MPGLVDVGGMGLGDFSREDNEALVQMLRGGLAEGVRHVDAFGRVVRGDGSLVEEGEEGRE